MATYVVTGAASLLGRLLLAELLDRPDCTAIHALDDSDSLAGLRRRWSREPRVVPRAAELTGAGLEAANLPGSPEHVVHLSRHGAADVLAYAAETGAGAVHLLVGADEQEPAHLSGSAPLSVYRTSVLVGDSRTGESSGSSPLLELLSRLAHFGRLPVIGPALGRTNLVPVDYVAAAMVHLMHRQEGARTYHLAAPAPQPVADVYNEFADAAGAPRIAAEAPAVLRRAARAFGGSLVATSDRVPTARATRRAVAREIGLSTDTFTGLHTPILRPNRAAVEGLRDSGLSVPHTHDYAGVLYRYWRRELDPDRARRARPRRGLTGRRVLITGASSGIGKHTALRVAELGGIPLLVARRADQLVEACDEITAAGGTAWSYPCDLTDGEAVAALVKRVLDEHGAVDVLVNNAGRSIRRSVVDSADRLHDYERTMAVNYFAAVRLTLGLLPAMRERGSGHVVNVTTQGIQNHTPRFSAYLSSKAALEEFGLVAGRETLSDGITFSSVKLPLVSTEMTAPSEEFNAFAGIPFMGVQRARDLVVKAIVRRPESVRVIWPAGRPAELASMIAPRTVRALTHLVGFEASPDRATRRPVGLPAIAAGAARLLWRRL